MKKHANNLKAISPNPDNPRDISPENMASLKASIERLGDISTLTYDRNSGQLICGHQRRDVILQHFKPTAIEWGDCYQTPRGMERHGSFALPDGSRFVVRAVAWSPAMVREAMVIANSPELMGAYTAGLEELLELIKAETSEDDFEALRMDVLLESALVDPEVVEDEALSTDEDAPVISRAGDLWLLGDHRLLCGDATNAVDVGRLLGQEKPFLMVTDPPYGVNYDPEWRDEADLGIGERSRGKVQNDDRADWGQAYSLFPGDVVSLWHASSGAVQFASDLIEHGFEIRSQIVWAKQHFAMSRGHYHWQHEPCWYAVRKGRPASWGGDRTQSTLWQISNNNAFGGQGEEKNGHGTQKPVECMARPIRNHGRKGDGVYDPFCGSGTTIIAAEQLGRRCFAMEIDPRYCDVIVRRWEAHTSNEATLDGCKTTFAQVSKKRLKVAANG